MAIVIKVSVRTIIGRRGKGGKEGPLFGSQQGLEMVMVATLSKI